MHNQRLSIGTAQLGLDYGITNKKGKPSIEEAISLLDMAWDHNIKLLDTAQGYGDAEEVLEKAIGKGKRFKTTTKIKPCQERIITKREINSWEEDIEKTTKRLRHAEIETIMVHVVDDLKKDGSELLIEWLINLKKRGITKEIGVSIYKESDLIWVPQELLAVIQAPTSLYDQRVLKSDRFTEWKKHGGLLQARSVYLQGLILTASDEWPKWITHTSRHHHKKLEKQAALSKCTLADIAIGFLREQTAIDTIVVGLTNKEELVQLASAFDRGAEKLNFIWKNWEIHDEILLDPRRWPK